MIDLLADPWASGLMRRAFAEAVLAGALCGALGCFVLVRGLAFLGEGLAHALLLGVVLAFLLGAPLAVPVAAVAAFVVVAAGAIAADRRFGADVAMGVLLPSLFGLGVVLAALGAGYRARLEAALFGSILGVTEADLAGAVVVAVATAAVLAVAGKELVLASFDRAAAVAMGYRVRLLDLALLALVAVGAVMARLNGRPVLRSVVRQVTVGVLAAGATFLLGALFGVALE